MWNMIKKNLWGKLQDVYIIILVLIAIFTYQFYHANKVKVDNTGYTYDTGKRVKVFTKDANDSWMYYQKSFKAKTGNSLTYDSLDKLIDPDEGVDNAKKFSVKELIKNPDNLMYADYTITGYITSKVRTGKQGEDYLILTTPQGKVRVYYFGELPSQDGKSQVEITGMVLGRPIDSGDKYVSMVSNKSHIRTIVK